MIWCCVVKSAPSKAKQRRLLTRVPGTICATSRNTILPNQHAESVAVIIPALAFNLDMFTQRIKTGRFHSLYVIYQRIIGRCGHQSVRPVALIQHAAHKIWHPVQMNPWHARHVFLYLNSTKRAITVSCIEDHAISLQRNLHGIEVRTLRRPKQRIIHMLLGGYLPCLVHRKYGEKNVLSKLIFERQLQLKRARLYTFQPAYLHVRLNFKRAKHITLQR